MIALGADARVGGGEAELAAFATPTVVHFCSVLLMAAFISTPGQTAVTLSVCVGLAGLYGLVYAIRVLRHARRQKGYAPVLEDWICHAALPILSYALLLVTGLIFLSRPRFALYLVAAVVLVLLFVGIHNAWDAAVYMYARRKAAEPAPDA